MLASIRASGGIGGGGLRKVAEEDKRDRSAAAVPGAEPNTSSGGASTAPSGGGGLQDALNLALNKRKQKVSASGTSSKPPSLCDHTDADICFR